MTAGLSVSSPAASSVAMGWAVIDARFRDLVVPA